MKGKAICQSADRNKHVYMVVSSSKCTTWPLHVKWNTEIYILLTYFTLGTWTPIGVVVIDGGRWTVCFELSVDPKISYYTPERYFLTATIALFFYHTYCDTSSVFPSHLPCRNAFNSGNLLAYMYYITIPSRRKPGTLNGETIILKCQTCERKSYMSISWQKQTRVHGR